MKYKLLIIILCIAILGGGGGKWVNANQVYPVSYLTGYTHPTSPLHNESVYVRLTETGNLELLRFTTKYADIDSNVRTLIPIGALNLIGGNINYPTLMYQKQDGSTWVTTYPHTQQVPFNLGAPNNAVTSVIYLPNSAPIPTGFSHKGGNIFERQDTGYTVTIYVIRYTPPTTIGNLNIQ